jgi:hypothetical protein
MHKAICELIYIVLLTLVAAPVVFYTILIASWTGLYNIGYHGSKLFTLTPVLSLILAVSIRVWLQLRVKPKGD